MNFSKKEQSHCPNSQLNFFNFSDNISKILIIFLFTFRKLEKCINSKEKFQKFQIFRSELWDDYDVLENNHPLV